MEIRTHEKNPNNLIISNPTPEALKVARRLEANNWAKVQPNGSIVAHIKVRSQFESLLPQTPVAVEPVAEIVAPEFADFDEFDDWTYNNLPDGIYRHLVPAMKFGRAYKNFTGKTVTELKEKYQAYI